MASRAGLVESKQEHLRHYMNGLHEYIQQILELQHLKRADYAFQAALVAKLCLLEHLIWLCLLLFRLIVMLHVLQSKLVTKQHIFSVAPMVNIVVQCLIKQTMNVLIAHTAKETTKPPDDVQRRVTVNMI